MSSSVLTWVSIVLVVMAGHRAGVARVATQHPADRPGPSVVLADLWRAIVQVESGGNARAIGDGGKAVGIVQIHAVCVEDVNRILALTGAAKRYTLADRLSPVRSREMFDIYVAYYGLRWAKQHGVERVPVSVLARIWNGGPRGPERESTLLYWHKVQRFLEVER